MQVDYSSVIRWLVSRISSCVEKLGGGWELDKVQRTAKLYDDDGVGKYVGLTLLLLAAVIVAAREQTNSRRMAKKRGTGPKYSQLRAVCF